MVMGRKLIFLSSRSSKTCDHLNLQNSYILDSHTIFLSSECTQHNSKGARDSYSQRNVIIGGFISMLCGIDECGVFFLSVVL